MTFSKTALMVAAYRARASARTNPLCLDPYARALAGDDGMEVARVYDGAYPHAELWVALRTAEIDAHAERLLCPRGPMTQLVILGAGLDTRAARLCISRPSTACFEVDRPDTQAAKLERVGRIATYPVDRAKYVAANFEASVREDGSLADDHFMSQLASSGFRADEPALFIWEGVSMYLSEAAVRATLRAVSSFSHPRSAIIFDHVGKKLIGGRVDAADESTRSFLSTLGEPLRFGFDEAVSLVASEGYTWSAAKSFDQIALARTGTYDRARKLRFQHIVVASPEPHEPPEAERVCVRVPGPFAQNIATVDRYRPRDGTSHPTIVLLHGAGRDASVFHALTHQLAGFEIVVPNLPGRGGSLGPAFESVSECADWTSAVLSACDIGPRILVGHSFGGGVALELAIRASDPLLRGLVLISTGARLRVKDSIFAERAEEVSRGVHDSEDPTAHDVSRYAVSPEVALIDWRAADRFDRMNEVSEIQMPTLILSGENDEWTPPKYARFLNEKIYDSKLVSFADAGHMLFQDLPVRVADSITKFLRSARVSGAVDETSEGFEGRSGTHRI